MDSHKIREMGASADTMAKTAFFAYPADPSSVGKSVESLVEATKRGRTLSVTPWPTMGAQGLKIDSLIRERIDEVDFLAFDLTYPNFNVYYEAGYAIGSGKPAVPTLNYSIEHSHRQFLLTGIFDTLGQARYQNTHELLDELNNFDLRSLRSGYIRGKDHAQPLFMLDTQAKTDFRNFIVNTIAHSKVGVRLFDPSETPRLSVATAIAEISSSAGVIIPLIATELLDSLRHNLRAAFLAGLCHGLKIQPLIIQYEDHPAPIDFRDDIDTGRSRREVEKSVDAYCTSTLIKNQQIFRQSKDRRSLLERIDIGTSAAEREAPKLDSYFIRTAQFARALRSTGSVVAGRKGSGKSAIFYQVNVDKSEDRRNLVIELNPASHNLSQMREALLSVMSAGVFDHTIAAFWQYVLYAEILIKVREAIAPRAKFSMSLLTQIDAIEKKFKLTDEMVAADFTSRLEIAVKSVVDALHDVADGAEAKAKLTNILFDRDIPALRDAISGLAGDFENIHILFDNIDKGWPARRVEESDIKMVRHLIDVLNKMQRELRRKEIEFSYLIFIRSDVYERLVEHTSDRGKYDLISVDWIDPTQLERLIKDRVTHNFNGRDAEEAWATINPAMPNGSYAVRYMIESSLMRPRFLIDLCEKAISFAINRGHGKVDPEDVEAAVEQHSRYLVSDFGYEVRDVSGISENIFYAFIGEPIRLSQEEVLRIIRANSGEMQDVEALSLLLWYGFLGICSGDGGAIYIYDRGYDIRRLEAERMKMGDELRYAINPAFLRGL